ncbi:MAG: 2Fe-2S iron-sulfur cluster-binding protein [Armatimonadia bacterium]
MPTLTIDGQAVTVPAGATILDAARLLGVEIPTLCHRAGCRPETSCLVCVVRVNGSCRLVPSCATPAIEGMVVESETDEVLEARRTALELLLGDHLGDCLAPCQMTCPAGLNIPDMLRLLDAGRMTEAVALVKRRIPLPAIVGRLCPANCERGCRRAQLDSAIPIACLEQQVGDYDLQAETPYRPLVPPATGMRIAVVGSGLVGLIAAWMLRREGHAVTIMEPGERLGGELLAIPEDQLPASVREAEIRRVLELGIAVRLQAAAEPDGVARQYDAVVRTLPLDEQATLPENVFAVGTPDHAARAVASGREVARQISAHLRGEAAPEPHRPFSVHMRRLEADELRCMSDCRAGACSPPQPLSATAQTAGYEPPPYSGEAQRCLECDCAEPDTCALRRWAAAYAVQPRRFAGHERKFELNETHPLIVYEPGKCIACGLCVQIAERYREPLGLTFIGRGFTVRPGVPWDETLAEGLQRAARECAEACPTAALTLRRQP